MLMCKLLFSFVYIIMMHLELIGCYMHALYLMLLCKLVFQNDLAMLGSRNMVKDCIMKILFYTSMDDLVV